MEPDFNKNNHNSVLKGQDAPAEVIFVDPITLPIARHLAKYKWLHPLHVTLLAFIFRSSAALLFVLGLHVYGAVASIIGFYLDGIDGKIARVRHVDEEIHGTIDFLLDQVAFGIMGTGALVWATYSNNNLAAVLIGGWIAAYMILMAFTSTWFRILSQHGLVYKFGVGKEIFDDTVKIGTGNIIYTILIILKNTFISLRKKLARFRMTPYFGAIESEIVIFMIAPFFDFNIYLLLLSIVFLLPDTVIIVTLSIMKVLKARHN